MPGGHTPEHTDVDSDDDPGNITPTGDLAELTQSLVDAMPTNSDFEGGGDRVQYTGKGKGVGKGKSGSSGPPTKKLKKKMKKFPSTRTVVTTSQPQRSQAPGAEGDSEEPTATQTITVGTKRGYSYYPTYLFDVQPKKLKIDHLRKKYLISEIARSNTQKRFYRNAMILMSHVKEFLRLFAASNLGDDPNSTREDHDYTLQDHDQHEDSSSDEDLPKD